MASRLAQWYGPKVLINALLDNRNRPKKDLSGKATNRDLDFGKLV